MNTRMQQLVGWVREHAVENYNRDGWDVLVECWSDDEIASCIGEATTFARAKANCRATLRTIDSVRSDIQGA